MNEIAELRDEVKGLREMLQASLQHEEEARCRREGLIGYEGLRVRLSIDGKLPALRTVRKIVAKHRGILRPVPLGHRSVGFRIPRVEALLAHLAGDPVIGGRAL